MIGYKCKHKGKIYIDASVNRNYPNYLIKVHIGLKNDYKKIIELIDSKVIKETTNCKKQISKIYSNKNGIERRKYD